MSFGGYDFEVVGAVAKDYQCPVCYLLLKDSLELPCGHCMCKTCLFHWERARPGRKVCPSCKTVYLSDNIIKSLFLDRVVKTSIAVKCKAHNEGCGWTGVIVDYDEHKNVCNFRLAKCPLEGCELEMLVDKVEEHKITCNFRFIECQYCSLEVHFHQLEDHQEDCDKYPTNCPNADCDEVFPRDNLENHLGNQCQFQQIDCDYVFVGCNVKLQKRHKQVHNNCSIQSHMNFLLEHSKQASALIEDLEEKHTRKTEELRDTKQELDGVKEQLDNLIGREELSRNRERKSQDEIKSLKEELKKLTLMSTVVKSDMDRINNSSSLTKQHQQHSSMPRLPPASIDSSNITLEERMYARFHELDETQGDFTLRKLWNIVFPMHRSKPKDYKSYSRDLINAMAERKLYKVGNEDNEMYMKVSLRRFDTNYLYLDVYPAHERAVHEGMWITTILYSDSTLTITSKSDSGMILIYSDLWTRVNTKLYIQDRTSDRCSMKRFYGSAIKPNDTEISEIDGSVLLILRRTYQ